MAEPDIAAWANACALNPSRIPSERREDPEVLAMAARLHAASDEGRKRMAELGGESVAGAA